MMLTGSIDDMRQTFSQMGDALAPFQRPVNKAVDIGQHNIPRQRQFGLTVIYITFSS
jgi:hypothetical protein